MCDFLRFFCALFRFVFFLLNISWHLDYSEEFGLKILLTEGRKKSVFSGGGYKKKLLSIVLLFYSIFQDQKISQLGSALNWIFKIWGGPIRKILKCHKKFIAKLLISEVYFSRVFKKALFSLCTIFYSNISWYSYFVTININYNIYSVDYVKKCVVLHTIMIDL